MSTNSLITSGMPGTPSITQGIGQDITPDIPQFHTQVLYKDIEIPFFIKRFCRIRFEKK